jgi:hypothetical protein
MSNHENYSSPEVEITMLKSELAEVFQTNIDTAEFYQPTDLEQPVEIVLGGKCRFTNKDGEKSIVYVHVRQRLDDSGTNYLMITKYQGEINWYQINDIDATRVYVGAEVPIGNDEAVALRLYINPEKTRWTANDSEIYAEHKNIYDTAHRYANRSNDHVEE